VYYDVGGVLERRYICRRGAIILLVRLLIHVEIAAGGVGRRVEFVRILHIEQLFATYVEHLDVLYRPTSPIYISAIEEALFID